MPIVVGYLICRSYFLLFSEISGDFGEKPVKLMMIEYSFVTDGILFLVLKHSLFSQNKLARFRNLEYKWRATIK